MRFVLSLCIIVAAILVVGCQDNNMTGPVANSNNSFLKPAPHSGFLQFKGDVSPGSVGTGNEPVFHVDGSVSYSYAITGLGEDQFYDFSINTQARLVPIGGTDTQGTVNYPSDYQISTAGKQGVILVQRDYYVPEFVAKFHMILAIAEDNSFSVQSMWLDPLGTTQRGAKTN